MYASPADGNFLYELYHTHNVIHKVNPGRVLDDGIPGQKRKVCRYYPQLIYKTTFLNGVPGGSLGELLDSLRMESPMNSYIDIHK